MREFRRLRTRRRPCCSAGCRQHAYVRPISGVIIALLIVVFFSYQQTSAIRLAGLVHRRAPRIGAAWLLAAAALLLDMVGGVGISAGGGLRRTIFAAAQLALAGILGSRYMGRADRVTFGPMGLLLFIASVG